MEEDLSSAYREHDIIPLRTPALYELYRSAALRWLEYLGQRPEKGYPMSQGRFVDWLIGVNSVRLHVEMLKWTRDPSEWTAIDIDYADVESGEYVDKKKAR
jgi:hypothetical protein